MGEVTRPGWNSRCGGELGEYRHRTEPVEKTKDREEWENGFLSLCRASDIFVSKGAFPSVFFFQHVTLYLLKFLLFGHAVRNVGISSLTRDQTHAPCIGCVVLTLDWKFPFPPLLFFTGGCLATEEMCWGKDLGERER